MLRSIEEHPRAGLVVVGILGIALTLGAIGAFSAIADDPPVVPAAPESHADCMAAVVAGDELISALLDSSASERALLGSDDSDAGALAEEVARLEAASDRLGPAGDKWFLLRRTCLGLEADPSTTSTTVQESP